MRSPCAGPKLPWAVWTATLLLVLLWAAASAPLKVVLQLSTQKSNKDKDENIFKNTVDKLANLPNPLSCHANDGFDIAGDAAFNWGITFHVKHAGECCAACAKHQTFCADPKNLGKVFWETKQLPDGPTQKQPPPVKAACHRGALCNAWVFCPGDPTGPATDRCFSYTIHNHSQGECWLKHEANLSHPVAHGPLFPKAMVAASRKDWPWPVEPSVWPWPTPGRRVTWQSGIVAPRKERTWVGTRLPIWHHLFCKKFDCGSETRADAV